MDKTKFLKKNNIDVNSKLIIGIGDSFCAGTGSEPIERWEKNNWDVEKMRSDGEGISEAYENSFINLLSKKYLTDFISINLGMSGKGNIFAIRELFLNPTLNLEISKEKYVIFVVSSFERYDFIKNISTMSNHSTTLWPYDIKEVNKIGYGNLLDENGNSIYNERFTISEFILNFYNLINWCELHNAKLFFISAFTQNLNMYHFLDVITQEEYNEQDLIVASKLISKLPWHRQIKPMGFDCITDMLLHLEKREDLIENGKFRDFKIDKISEYGYMSKCQHPTKKGQDLLCDIIYEHILNYNNIDVVDNEKICLEYLQKKYNKEYNLKYNETI